MKAKSTEPSKELLIQVRAALVLQGTSFSAWCKANNVVRRTAEQSLTGYIQSDNARSLVRRIVVEANIAAMTP
jgi:hypothetical protein